MAASLGVSGPTVDRYLDLLVDLGLVRRLLPWHVNTSKRVTKAPKVFVKDSGLLHALLELPSFEDVLSHPSAGASYESFVVESLISVAPDGWRPFHYRTARGDEVDLVFVRGTTPVLAVEVKRSSAPTVSAGFHRAVDDLGQPRSVVVHPDTGHAAYPGAGGTTVVGLTKFVGDLRAAHAAQSP